MHHTANSINIQRWARQSFFSQTLKLAYFANLNQLYSGVLVHISQISNFVLFPQIQNPQISQVCQSQSTNLLPSISLFWALSWQNLLKFELEHLKSVYIRREIMYLRIRRSFKSTKKLSPKTANLRIAKYQVSKSPIRNLPHLRKIL